MTYGSLATGITAKAAGLLPDEGFWLAMIVLAIAVGLELFLFKSIRDRRVLGEKPVVGATVVLALISMACFCGWSAAFILLMQDGNYLRGKGTDMEKTLENTVLGLSPELAQGLSLLLFVFGALMLLLLTFVVMKRKRRGQKALPGAGIVLLMICVASFVGALVLKLL